MALIFGDKLLDSGLGYVSSNADRIYICSAQPTSYTQATSTYALGYKDFGVGGVAGTPTSGTGTRKVTTNPVSGGTVSAVGTVAYWAIVDTVNSLLLATGELTGGVLTTMGMNWTLDQIAIAWTGVLTGRIFDTATTTWAAAVVTAGGTVSNDRKILVDDLILGLKADGIWDKLDRLWLFAAENRESAYTDLVAQGYCTATAGHNPAGFWVDQAIYAFGRGATQLKLNYIPSTDAVRLSQNSAHISVWAVNNDAGANDCWVGYYGTNTGIYVKNTATTANVIINSTGNLIPTLPFRDNRGLMVANRSASNAMQAYLNGNSLGSTTATSSALFTNTWLLDYGQNAAASIGASLTSTEQAALYNRILTYLQALYGVSNIETMGWIQTVKFYGSTVSSARRTLVDNLITGLKADGVWWKLDRLWLFAAENAYSALIDVRMNTVATAVNAPTLTVNRGYAGNGTSSYIDTNFNPTVAGLNFTQNSASAFAWNNTLGSSSAPWVLSAPNSLLNVDYSANRHDYMTVNGSTFSEFGSQSGALGLYLVSRTSSAGADENFYLNGGSSLATGVTSTTIASGNFLVLKGQGASEYGTRQLSCAGMGTGLTSAENTSLYNRLRTYMTAVGVP